MSRSTEIIRRFRTDYAGAFCGNCSTRESAIMASMLHVVRDGYSRATIIDRVTDEVVARVRIGDNRKSAIVETIKPMKKIGL